jgi:hypothetical protein
LKAGLADKIRPEKIPPPPVRSIMRDAQNLNGEITRVFMVTQRLHAKLLDECEAFDEETMSKTPHSIDGCLNSALQKIHDTHKLMNDIGAKLFGDEWEKTF